MSDSSFTEDFGAMEMLGTISEQSSDMEQIGALKLSKTLRMKTTKSKDSGAIKAQNINVEPYSALPKFLP
jgi:hypothetical protein